MKRTFDAEQIDFLREYLELLLAVETIQYHNKNWLPEWANDDPKILNTEKRYLLEKALFIVGSSATQLYT